jgi:hypothetical protein
MVETWVAILLGLGAIGFPIARIIRISWLTHIADFLLFIPLLHLGIKFILRANAIPSKS